MGLAANPEYGGQGLPYVLHSAVGEYPFLGQHGLCACIPA